MIKVPYGISNFETLVNNDYYYVDRTNYIETLESLVYRYLIFLRPRKFGKSLFLSTLDYYYNVNHQNNFKSLFNPYYIGQNPTPLANQYLILRFDFSQIDTSSFENTFQGFLQNVKTGGIDFYGKYVDFFDDRDIERIRNYTYPSHIIQDVITEVHLRTPYKIYLLIDEYDHFTNEILSFRFNEFMTMVGQNGFVRKFYEAIKVGTHQGTIDRLFITGVSPITLDSLTSGFNIATNITLEEEFNEMLGFSEQEVVTILKGVHVPLQDLAEVLLKMKLWYNGYKFNEDAVQRVYNSNMILYFAAHYGRKQRYPRKLLDPNIASDYNKIRKSFKIKGKEKEHLKHLNKLLETKTLQAQLVHQYDLERQFGADDFISLLFYQGIITIWETDLGTITFKMPNYVIEELYFQYFHQVILEETNMESERVDVHKHVVALARNNNMQPLVRYTESILQELALRDKINFDEKYIKVIFTSAFYVSGIYTIANELEVKKGETDKGFVDLILMRRPPYTPTYQFVIEFKYIKKQDAAQTPKVKKAAVAQLKNYLKHEPLLQKMDNLKAYVVIFVGNKGEVIELEI